MNRSEDPGARPDRVACNRLLAAALRDAGIAADLARLGAGLAASTDREAALRAMFACLPDDWVIAQLRAAAARHLQDPAFRLNAGIYRSGAFNGITIHEDENVFIVLTSVSALELARRELELGPSGAGKRSVSVVAGDTLLRFVRARDAGIRIWRSPLVDFATPLGPDQRCTDAGTRVVNSGDEMFLRGGEENMTIESTAAPLLVLSATVAARVSPVVAEYDRDSREVMALSAADPRASRIQLLATMMRAGDPSRVCPTFAPLLAHRDYFVRWYLMREMLAADAGSAMPHLRTLAAADPHPQVRALAQATLAKFEEAVACP